jgi:lysozyme
MRTITQQGLDLIKQFEGFSPTIYTCPAGYATIGYGHLVRSTEHNHFASGITEQQAENLLRQDVQLAENAVLRLIHVPLTNGQFDALTSFCFNLGSGALQSSTLRRVVNREEHYLAPAQFRRWVYTGGRRLRRLQRRREAEAADYSSL